MLFCVNSKRLWLCNEKSWTSMEAALGILDNAKEIADLIKKIGDIELYRKIVELEGEIIELTRKNRILEEEIEQLHKERELSKALIFKKPFYYMNGDEIPYCPNCWEIKKIVTHLDGPVHSETGQERYECHNCGNKWYIGEFQTPDPGSWGAVA